MMKDLDESPGMCSDCPRITPKSLDLEVSPTCLREKEREPLESGAQFGAGEKGTPKYKPKPTTSFCPVADRPRYPGGPSAS
jgi:hypothetical protein